MDSKSMGWFLHDNDLRHERVKYNSVPSKRYIVNKAALGIKKRKPTPEFSQNEVKDCFRGRSKINLKVYDVINCLNKNLVTHFVLSLEKEKRYDIEILSIDRALNKEKSCRNCAPKASPKPIFNFGK